MSLYNDIRFLSSHFKLRTFIFSFLLSSIGFFLGLCGLNGFCGNCYLESFRFLFTAVRFGLGNGNFCIIFTLDSGGISSSNLNTLFLQSVSLTYLTVSARLSHSYLCIVCSFGFSLSFFLTAYRFGLSNGYLSVVFTLDCGSVCGSNLNTLILTGVSLAYSTVPVLFGNTFFSVVNSLCGSFLTKRVDIARLVVNIGNVYVDKPQTYLFQLNFNVVGHCHKELVTVGIDLFNLHGSNYQTQLTEDDILCKFLYLHHLKSKQTLGCVLHDTRLGRNTYCETGWYVHTDILL